MGLNLHLKSTVLPPMDLEQAILAILMVSAKRTCLPPRHGSGSGTRAFVTSLEREPRGEIVSAVRPFTNSSSLTSLRARGLGEEKIER